MQPVVKSPKIMPTELMTEVVVVLRCRFCKYMLWFVLLLLHDVSQRCKKKLLFVFSV